MIGALPDDASNAVYDALHTGLLSKSVGLEHNPCPAPGIICKDRANQNGVGSSEVRSKQGFVYPRVYADC